MLMDGRLRVHSLGRTDVSKRGIAGRVGKLLRRWIGTGIVADEMKVIA